MKEIVEETLKKLVTPAEKAEEDYIGEDGLLYCGKCHVPKEAYLDQELAQRFGMKTHPKECDCQSCLLYTSHKLDVLIFAADTINTSKALDDTYRIPVDIVVDQVVAILQVLTFGNTVCSN